MHLWPVDTENINIEYYKYNALCTIIGRFYNYKFITKQLHLY